MGNEEDSVTPQRDDRCVRCCTECRSRSIEDSLADIAHILLRKLIRDEFRPGKSNKEIFKKLEDEYGETVLYCTLPSSTCRQQPCGCLHFLSLVLLSESGHTANNDKGLMSGIMAWSLVKGHSMALKEEDTMMDLVTLPPPEWNPDSWWRRWHR